MHFLNFVANHRLMDYNTFYIEFGRLLYAIAKSDGFVQKEEWEKVIRIVREELTPLDDSEDEFGTDNAFYAEFEFERLVDRQSSVKDAFLSFIMFTKENLDAMPQELRKTVIRSVEKVAISHGGIDETEGALIKRLKSALEI